MFCTMGHLRNFVVLLVVVVGSALLTDAVDHIRHYDLDNVFVRSLRANISTNVTFLSAPYYRNVTAGNAWVVPSSAYDLGARDMSCECFDPAESCCMAQSKGIAPFCIPNNSTCCANTFCNSGETCCGDFCCAKVSIQKSLLMLATFSNEPLGYNLLHQQRNLRLLSKGSDLFRSSGLL